MDPNEDKAVLSSLTEVPLLMDTAACWVHILQACHSHHYKDCNAALFYQL